MASRAGDAVIRTEARVEEKRVTKSGRAAIVGHGVAGVVGQGRQIADPEAADAGDLVVCPVGVRRRPQLPRVITRDGDHCGDERDEFLHG